MPKRTRENDNFDYIRKKLKKLENQINKSRKKSRIISSSSSESSREPSPLPQDQQVGTPHKPEMTRTTSTVSAIIDSVMEPSTYEQAGITPDVIDAGASTCAPVNETAATVDTLLPEDCLDSILLDILGEDPTTTEEYGPEIHKDLATRFNHLATTGLDPKIRKELTNKYLIPANSTRIAAPLLNDEIKAALPESMVKRDKQLEFRQKQIATTIACLSSIITDQLNVTLINQELLKKLMDSARLLCDVQHKDSITRRNFALYSLKKDMKEHLNNTKIDKLLFGENLGEALRAAKAVNKSSSDLKIQNKSIINKPVTSQTISRWIKCTMDTSGIDTSIFSAHSTRHAATSRAHASGVGIDQIRKTAGWSASSNTFAKFYNRAISNSDETALAKSLLS